MDNGALEERLVDCVEGETEIGIVKNTEDETGYDLVVGFYNGRYAQQQLVVDSDGAPLILRLKGSTSFERSYRKKREVPLLGKKVEYKDQAPLVVSRGLVEVSSGEIYRVLIGGQEIANYMRRTDAKGLKPFADAIEADLNGQSELF